VDVVERLSLEAANKYTSQSCEHIHRYELAAALCEGQRVLDLACGSGYGSGILAARAASVHGVDKDVASVDLAAATVGSRMRATFEAADARAYLEGELAEHFDAIVCFEGLEHLEALPEVVRVLRGHRERGVAIVASVPNSRAFAERNQFHVTDFGYEQARELLDDLGGGVMLYQHLTEGSMITTGSVRELPSRQAHRERAERDYANHFVLIVNVDETRRARAESVLRMIVEAPVHNRYMRGLEVANVSLQHQNASLGRKLLHEGAIVRAKTGSAAPSLVASLDARVEELEAQVLELEAALEARHGDLRHREEMILAQRRELLALRQELVMKTS
jgi:SAM-dependent methyltransferase